jgi:hypothetical protein
MSPSIKNPTNNGYAMNRTRNSHAQGDIITSPTNTSGSMVANSSPRKKSKVIDYIFILDSDDEGDKDDEDDVSLPEIREPASTPKSASTSISISTSASASATTLTSAPKLISTIVTVNTAPMPKSSPVKLSSKLNTSPPNREPSPPSSKYKKRKLNKPSDRLPVLNPILHASSSSAIDTDTDTNIDRNMDTNMDIDVDIKTARDEREKENLANLHLSSSEDELEDESTTMETKAETEAKAAIEKQQRQEEEKTRVTKERRQKQQRQEEEKKRSAIELRQKLAKSIMKSSRNVTKKKKVVSILKKGKERKHSAPVPPTDDVNANSSSPVGNDNNCDKESSSITTKHNKNSSNEGASTVPFANILKSYTKMVRKVNWQPAHRLKEIKFYEVDPREYMNYVEEGHQHEHHEQQYQCDGDCQNDMEVDEMPLTATSPCESSTSATTTSAATSTTTGQPTGEGDDETNPPQKCHYSNELVECAINGTLQEMISLLKMGWKARGSDDKKHKPLVTIKEQKEILKQEERELRKKTSTSNSLSAISKFTTRTKEVRNTLNDFQQKTHALKIFKKAEEAIDLARGLHGIKTFKFEMLQIRDLKLTEEGRRITGDDDVLYFRFMIDGRNTDIYPKPMISCHDYDSVTFEENHLNGQAIPKHYTSCIDLKLLLLKGRCVKIHLMKNSRRMYRQPKSESSATLMCTWEISLGDVYNDVAPDSPLMFSDERMRSKRYLSHYLNDANLDIRVSLSRRDEVYFKRKRGACAHDIKEVHEWICNFQHKASKSIGCDSPLIDVNDLTFFGNTSLLHAAVFVYDIDLIEKLLRQKANKTIRSTDLGTVFDLANHLSRAAKAKGDHKREHGFQQILRQLQE